MTDNSRLLRVVGWALGGGFVAVVLAGAGTAGYWRLRGKIEEKVVEQAQVEQKVTDKRVQRQQAVIEVAPAPMPRGLPLVVREGLDEFGAPRSYVDGPGLRSLLELGRYEELTAAFEEFQKEFEADWRKERWPVDAARAFRTSVPRLLPLLDAWQAKTPDSFAPYLARGTYLASVAADQRGGRWAKDTAAADFGKMNETAARALADLEQANRLHPRAWGIYPQRLRALRLLSEEPTRKRVLQESERVCPGCMNVRASYLMGATPRWGGSYEGMSRVAEEAPTSQHPRLVALRGFGDADRANLANLADRYEEALLHAEKACAVAAYPWFFEERAEALRGLGRLDGALGDLNRAIDLDPGNPDLLLQRARVLQQQGKSKEAAADLLAGMRVDSTSSTGRSVLGLVYQSLVAEADRAMAAQDATRAIELYELAQSLYPFARDVQMKRAAAITSGLNGTPAEVAELEAAMKRTPDDFVAFLRFDYVLAKRREYPRIIAAWSDFISRHPDDARAHYERSGAYYNSGHRAEATRDAARACELGLHAACGIRQAIAPSPGRAQ